MGKKLVSIAGIIFAVVFVAVFLFIWSKSSNIFKTQMDSINSLYESELPFDMSLFNNRVVSGNTLNNFATDLGKSAYTTTAKLSFYDSNDTLRLSPDDYIDTEVSEFDANSEYLVYYHDGDNGNIDGIVAEKVN